jgi:hypothetical protein
MFVDDDISAMFQDFGLDVEFNGSTTKGILDAPGRNIDISGLPQVCTTDFSLTFKTSALPGFKSGSTLAVDGTCRIAGTRSATD